jgi:proteasome lid subunit RPN8/RPN11
MNDALPVPRLLLTERQRTAVARHAVATYPEECCGVLLGAPPPAEGPPVGRVERLLALDNERADSRHNRFLITPERVLEVHREARRLGLEVLGYYHSHPDHPAVPSEYDREHAWPGMSYVIVSVRAGQAAETRSWRLADDRSRFEEEDLVTEAAPPAVTAGGVPAEEVVT